MIWMETLVIGKEYLATTYPEVFAYKKPPNGAFYADK